MLKLGVITRLTDRPDQSLANVAELGLPTCQLNCWDMDCYAEDMARKVIEASEQTGVEISSLWSGYPGPQHWNFTEGPSTLGLVPPEFREMRVEALKKGAWFAELIGVPSITTHAGFIPENASDPLYEGTIEALRAVALECRSRGIEFWFETGQETPVALLRAITDIGTDNLGINLDPANLILYGKANPVDALDVFGHLVKGMHAKDGRYPTNPWELGHETPLGEGKVDFPALMSKLKALGYTGAVTIEREISGPQQIEDIKRAMSVLMPLCSD